MLKTPLKPLIMNNEFDTVVDELEVKYKNPTSNEIKEDEGMRRRLRALLAALVGVSLAACAFASQPDELELGPPDTTRRPCDAATVGRVIRPTVRVLVGCSRLNACVTALASLMLLIAVMCEDWWSGWGSRYLAAPALLMAAQQAAADAADALLAAVLRTPPAHAGALARVLGGALLVSIDVYVWFLIAKFFDYEPPQKPGHENNKDLLTGYLKTDH